jgi:hypothetical protein
MTKGAWVDGHRREALVGEPPDIRPSGGSLRSTPATPEIGDEPGMTVVNSGYGSAYHVTSISGVAAKSISPATRSG